jgi:hypothetical protein
MSCSYEKKSANVTWKLYYVCDKRGLCHENVMSDMKWMLQNVFVIRDQP